MHARSFWVCEIPRPLKTDVRNVAAPAALRGFAGTAGRRWPGGGN